MDFQRIADQAVETSYETPRVPLSNVRSTFPQKEILYVIDGIGLWRLVERDSMMTFRRLFSAQTVRISGQDWIERCLMRRVKEVGDVRVHRV